MKKKFFATAAVALVAAAVSVFVYVNNGKNEMYDLFNANVEALADIETGGIVSIPCVRAVSKCYYTVKDANGDYYMGSTSGMRNN